MLPACQPRRDRREGLHYFRRNRSVRLFCSYGRTHRVPTLPPQELIRSWIARYTERGHLKLYLGNLSRVDRLPRCHHCF